MATVKAKCPICGNIKTVELTATAPICENDMMDMMALEVKA